MRNTMMHVKTSIRFLAFAALAALWIFPATVFADTPATTQWVVTSAKASGGGNDYVTSLRIVNPNATAAPVDMYFLPASGLDGSNNALGDNSGAQPVRVTVPANQTLALDDVLFTKFGTTGDRTNLFLLSANGTGATVVDVTLRNSDGTTIGTKTLTLGKFSQTQINGIANFFGYTPAASETNMTAIVKVTSGGPVATGASVIDNAIGSISYSPPVKIPVANNGAYGLILNDGGYGFSGRADVFAGSFDFLSAGVVIPSCAGQPTLFFVQGIGTPGIDQNATFTKNADGSTSFTGTTLTNFDGTIYGTLTYTRGVAPGDTCPGATVTLTFSGSKGAVL